MKAPGTRCWAGRSPTASSASPCTAQPSTCCCTNTARRPAFPLPSIPTYCALPAALPSPTRAKKPCLCMTISSTATFSTAFATQPITQLSTKSCNDSCCTTKKPRLYGEAIKHLSCRKTQPMALITSGVLLPLIRLRSLRLKPNAAPTPRSGRGPGTILILADTHEPGHPA